jgi:ribosomal protein S18 acetylase RimI-like enzyme
MPEIEIRPVKAEDIQEMLEIEHNYSTEYVWQMDYKQGDGEIIVSFREVRLPRAAQVMYPKGFQSISENWSQRDGLLVSQLEEEVVGYISLDQNPLLKATWVTDLAVKRQFRRQGIGSALVIAAQEWALNNKSRRLILEMQPKNFPTIQLAKKLGFELCGYNDHYFANHDIALFFSKWLR